MINRLLSLLKKDAPAHAGTDMTALRAEIQALKLDLAEKEREADQLKAQLDLQRNVQADERITAEKVEKVFRTAASPAAQLITQEYLFGEQGRPVGARDVLPVARRLVAALEDAGLSIDGRPGDAAQFDQDRHVGVDANRPPETGEPVMIRIPGVSLNGKVLARAVVEKLGEQP